MPKKLLVIGHLAKDVVKTRYGEGEFWGGAAYHVAMAAAMFLEPGMVAVRSIAGKDFDKRMMSKQGVLTDFVEIDQNTDSDKHLLDESGETRQYICKGSLSNEIMFDDLENIINEVGWIHLASSPPEQQLVWLEQLQRYRRKDIIVSCDTFDTFASEAPETVCRVFSKCDLGFLNNMEWKVTKKCNLNGKLIRKMGGKGAELYENGKLVLNVRADSVKVVKDTTGAGEVLAGVYIAQKILGKNDKQALEEACKVASKSVGEFGTDHLRL